MVVPILKLISNLFWKDQPRPRRETQFRHLMLAGISQNIFLKEWGNPEIKVNLDHFEKFYRRIDMSSETDSGEPLYSVWIYKNKDRIFFFTKKKLVSHFRWSDFKEKRENPLPNMHPRFVKRHSTLVPTTLAMVG